MIETSESLGEAPGDRTDDASIGMLLSRLVDDSEQFVRAEVKLYRAQAILRLVAARSAVIMIALGMVIILATAIALLIGLILILAPIVGRAGAVAIVVIGSLVVAGILIQTAIGKLRRITDLDAMPGDFAL